MDIEGLCFELVFDTRQQRFGGDKLHHHHAFKQFLQ